MFTVHACRRVTNCFACCTARCRATAVVGDGDAAAATVVTPVCCCYRCCRCCASSHLRFIVCACTCRVHIYPRLHVTILTAALTLSLRVLSLCGAVGEEVGAALALLRCSPALLLYYLPSLVCVAAAVSNVRLLVLLLLRVYVRCPYTTAVGDDGDGAVTITHERVDM